jgi:hypothetical protein
MRRTTDEKGEKPESSDLSRREFVATAGAVTAGLISSRTVPQSRSSVRMPPCGPAVTNGVNVYFLGVYVLAKGNGDIVVILPTADPLPGTNNTPRPHWGHFARKRPQGHYDSHVSLSHGLNITLQGQNPQYPPCPGTRMWRMLNIKTLMVGDDYAGNQLELKALSDPTIAAVIHLKGGWFDVTGWSDNTTYNNNGTPVPIPGPATIVTWYSGQPSLTVALPSGSKTFAASDELVVANAPESDLGSWNPSGCTSAVADDDFVVVFNAFKPSDTSQTLGNIIKGRPLPRPTAPCTHINAFPTPNVSTCYSGCWDAC